MGKKGRKGGKRSNDEGFNAKQQKAKDSITGLSLQLGEYGTLQSDKVYGPDSDFFQRANAASGFPAQGDSWLEVELGEDKIIVTTKFVGHSESFIDESYQRGVVTGKFNYQKGKLVEAVVNEISAYNVMFVDGETYLADSYIERFPQPRRVEDPTAVPPWEYALREEGGEYIFFAQESKEFNTDQGNVLDIVGYLGGKIYEAEYWKNPFATNLI
jgi:hypothetical protein